jgi:hypothetical protein
MNGGLGVVVVVLPMFAPNSLEGLGVCFLVEELACCRISFHEMTSAGVENLRTLADRAIAVAVADGWIGSHMFMFPVWLLFVLSSCCMPAA